MPATMSQKRLVRLMVIYGVALTVIAVTILSSSLLMRYSIERAAGDSRVINLAGRQRMLSQRLTKAVLALERDPEGGLAQERREELRIALREFVQAHEGIQHGSTELGLPSRPLSGPVRALFMQAEEPFRSMVGALQRLEAEPALHRGAPSLAQAAQVLLAQEPRFLTVMDRITFELDAESRARIQGLKALEWGILAVGFVVLALEFLFVFRPSLRSLSVMVEVLEHRGEELAAANQAYMELLPFVSHELKNPIASMITDARVMSEGYLGTLDERQIQKLEKLIAKGDYLLGLVREYMDLARIEGGDLRLNPSETHFVEDVLDPAVELIPAQIQEKGMVLVREYQRAEVEVLCDPNLVKIVVVNLLGNAAKYGREKGTIRLAYCGDAREVTVRVWNEGPGFSEQEQSRLFKKFSRLQTPELHAKKGTGVGLYTCDRIVKLHGGNMDARSEQGSWAEFSFRFPQPLPHPTPHEA
jgi:signal transduction histidine kinase